MAVELNKLTTGPPVFEQMTYRWLTAASSAKNTNMLPISDTCAGGKAGAAVCEGRDGAGGGGEDFRAEVPALH